MTSPTTAPPEGHEIISPDTLRKYGAVEGMMWTTKELRTNWTLVTSYYPKDTDEPWPEDESCFTDFFYCAPLGTTAALSTPLPEVRCKGLECIKFGPGDDLYNEHVTDCPCHPRNHLVRVLPGELAGLKVRPEGLMWCNGHHKHEEIKDTWELFATWAIWPRSDSEEAGDFAYALPQWSYDEAMGRGEEKPNTGLIDHLLACPHPFSTQPESEVKTCTPSKTDSSFLKSQAVVSNAAPETSEPFRAAATPRAEELLDKIERFTAFNRAEFTPRFQTIEIFGDGDGWNVKKNGVFYKSKKSLRLAIASAMKEGK